MRQGQIFLRAHLDQARHGAVELEGLPAALGMIELVHLGLGGGEKLHVSIVERIDEDDEALGLVAPLEGHARDVVEDDRVKILARRAR